MPTITVKLDRSARRAWRAGRASGTCPSPTSFGGLIDRAGPIETEMTSWRWLRPLAAGLGLARRSDERPVLLDTSFLIALEQETAADELGPARRFLPSLRGGPSSVDCQCRGTLEGATDETVALGSLHRFSIQGLHLPHARRCGALATAFGATTGRERRLAGCLRPINCADVVAADCKAFERSGIDTWRFVLSDQTCVKEKLHPRNRFRDGSISRADREQPAIGRVRQAERLRDVSVNLPDPAAVKALNQALLARAYGVHGWDCRPASCVLRFPTKRLSSITWRCSRERRGERRSTPVAVLEHRNRSKLHLFTHRPPRVRMALGGDGNRSGAMRWATALVASNSVVPI